LFSQVLHITVPVFGIAAVGFLFGKLTNINMETINRINMNLFVPILLFYLMTEKVPSIADLSSITISVITVVIGSGLVGILIAHLFKLPAHAIVPNLMFNNSGNLGLPLAALAFGEKVLPLSVFAWVISAWLNHSIGIWYLSGKWHPVEMFKNPAFSAAAIGLIFNILDIHTPSILLPGLQMLSQVAIPVLLISLGVKLTDIDTSHWKLGVMVAVLKPFVGVGIALLAIFFYDLSEEETKVLLLYGALPPAVVNFLFAERYNRYPHHSASIVAIGNLMALISVPIILSIIL